MFLSDNDREGASYSFRRSDKTDLIDAQGSTSCYDTNNLLDKLFEDHAIVQKYCQGSRRLALVLRLLLHHRHMDIFTANERVVELMMTKSG